MVIELKKMGHAVRSEVAVPIVYNGQMIHDEGFKIDILVDEEIVVELKSVEQLKDVHKKQLLTYLKLTQKPVGLLINFNESLLKDGIVRIVNHFQEANCSDSAVSAKQNSCFSATSAPLREI